MARSDAVVAASQEVAEGTTRGAVAAAVEPAPVDHPVTATHRILCQDRNPTKMDRTRNPSRPYGRTRRIGGRERSGYRHGNR